MSSAEEDFESLKQSFLNETFDVEEYTKKILESGVVISEQLATVASNTRHLDKQLRQQISNHHEKLLTQATSIESLEDILEVLNQHVFALKSCVDRATTKTNDLFRKTELRTLQLQGLHQTCNILRTTIRVVSLSEKLQAQVASGVSGGRDMVKCSQMLQELAELTHEIDLSGIEAVEKDLALVPRFTKEVKEQASEALAKGLSAQNHMLVGNALQALSNCKCLQMELKASLERLRSELLDTVRGLGKGEQKDNRGASGGPGGASLSAPPSSVLVRASLWKDVSKLADSLLAAQSQLEVLDSVVAKKKDGLNLSIPEASFMHEFWMETAELLKKEFLERSGLVRQTLESEYPKLVRQLMDVFRRVRGRDPTPERQQDAESLRLAIANLEHAYLSRSLSRLFDNLNLGFGDGSIPSEDEIENLAQIMASELQVTAFDERLFHAVVSNIAKTVNLFGSKCEQLLEREAEASQVIGRPNAAQQRNVLIINALFKLESCMKEQLKRLGDSMDTTATGWKQQLEKECETGLETVMEAALTPLLASMEDAIGAILDTIHKENFSFPLPPDAAPAEQQCSLYMRELQDFVSRVWQEHLAPLDCRLFVQTRTSGVARKACRLFLVHASLVRPLGAGGRLRLAADFAQLELALSLLCRRIASDLGPEYVCLRALRPLLFQSPGEMVESGVLGKQVPFWLVIQLLISQSPPEIPSPHVSAGWSVARYSEWLESHVDEAERLQFLRGTLHTYETSVQTSGQTQFADTYPLLAELLRRAADSCAPRSKTISSNVFAQL